MCLYSKHNKRSQKYPIQKLSSWTLVNLVHVLKFYPKNNNLKNWQNYNPIMNLSNNSELYFCFQDDSAYFLLNYPVIFEVGRGGGRGSNFLVWTEKFLFKKNIINWRNFPKRWGFWHPPPPSEKKPFLIFKARK